MPYLLRGIAVLLTPSLKPFYHYTASRASVMPLLDPARSLCRKWRSAKASFDSPSVRSFRATLKTVASKVVGPVFVFGMWVGFGDLCLEMSFWEALQQKYAGRVFYFAIPEDKTWILHAYNSSRFSILPISKECQGELENPFLFRLIQREVGDKGVCVYGKIACRGYLLMRGDFRIRLPLLNCYRHSLRLGKEAKPVPMPYELKRIKRNPKKVIFNLYSNSLFLNGSPVWPALFDACIELGLEIVCNQRGVPNRQCSVFSGSVQELRALYEECALLVSIRSGIMDFAFGSGINMLAVYPNSKSAMKAYTLKQWGPQREKVVEGFEREIIKDPKGYLLRALEDIAL